MVDRLSKYAHSIPLSHLYATLDVVKVYSDQGFKLHGLPITITSDGNPIFSNSVWSDFFKLQRMRLNKSTGYHPQTNYQTEIVNKCLETYVNCMCYEKPCTWSNWLPLTERWYNTHFHSSVQYSPYEVVYGQTPASIYFAFTYVNFIYFVIALYCC